MFFSLKQLFITFLYFLLTISLIAQDRKKIDFPIKQDGYVNKAIYSEQIKERGALYQKLWGKHYRDLYFKPVKTKLIASSALYNNFSVLDTIPDLQSLILNDSSNDYYMLKPINGISSFTQSGFFKNIYRKDDLKNTYVGDFINDAFTLNYPYIFLVSDDLAKSAKLDNRDTEVYFVSDTALNKASDVYFNDELISLSKLYNRVGKTTIHSNIDQFLDTLHLNSRIKLNTQLYVRARLFDMLIGDWNKIPENWGWIPNKKGDSIIYYPYSMDRSSSFSKVDGILFKQLMSMLGLSFITNYDKKLKNIKQFNTLSFPLDIALTQNTTRSEWIAEAKTLKKEISDQRIEHAFSQLPPEMVNEDTESLKLNLKKRRDALEDMANKYYDILQEKPIITGSSRDDIIIIDQDINKDLRIQISDKSDNSVILDKVYDKDRTKEIWLYSLDGNDIFRVNKEYKNIAVSLIGGKGWNEYDITHGNNIFIYEAKSEKNRLKYLSQAKVIIPDNEEAMNYDYQRLPHNTISFTPIGIYDSDLGLNLGTSIAYTIYGFRRAPFTRRHQVSYDYKYGFTYQGIFPSYDEKKSLHVAAFIGNPSYFKNFFGFGNNTAGNKDKPNNYNRVHINKYMLAPALYYNIDKDQFFNVCSSFELYKVKNSKDDNRFINTLYDVNNSIFSDKLYLNLSATYQIDKDMKHILSSFQFLFTPGWTLNILEPDKNFPYFESHFGINVKINDRLTFATMLKGKTIFSDKYEFFQAATTELRGFRNNRFIGRYSFYQYSDLRFDMGRLENPFTPLHYGVFVGADNGRVWYPQEYSKKWHSSYGGGFWLTLFRKFTGKFSYFASTDTGRFMFELGMGF